MSWAGDTVASETKALNRSRKAFVREPSAETLHQVRTGARRLRSLLEDVAALHVQKRLLRRVKRTSQLTDVARDSAVQRELLERVLDETEREAAQPLFEALRERELRATETSRSKLSRVRFAAKAKQ
jgi:CHAD domain-containing protein